MATILCTFPKGGVGKTVLAVHITGVLLSQTKGRVLLIDSDPRPDAWRFYMGRKPTGGEYGFFKVDSRLDIVWKPPQHGKTSNRFQPIKKAELDEYDYIVIDTDAPLEDAVSMISNNKPDLILSPINSSQKDTALEDLPDFLATLTHLCGLDYSPMVRIVPLGVRENVVSKIINSCTIKPDNCKATFEMKNLETKMSQAKIKRKYIWEYAGCEHFLSYFTSLLEIDI